jgi:hypothetical protein
VRTKMFQGQHDKSATIAGEQIPEGRRRLLRAAAVESSRAQTRRAGFLSAAAAARRAQMLQVLHAIPWVCEQTPLLLRAEQYPALLHRDSEFSSWVSNRGDPGSRPQS